MREMLKKVGAGLALTFGLVGVAAAELPAAATTAITSIQTDGLAVIDAMWPVIAAIVVGFVIIKLFKRGASKV
jgi:hypothetical protein